VRLHVHRTLFALAASVALAAAAAGAEGPPPPPSLSLTGSGSVQAAPDTGRISAGVVTEGRGAAEAVKANSAAMQRVLDALDKAGIPRKDVQTQGFSLSPVYAERPKRTEVPEIVGYRAENTVGVSVRGVEKVGGVLDQLVAAGANQLGGIAFSVGEPAPLLDEARRKAVADARRKAEVYAAAAGVKLGRVLRIEEEGGLRPEPYLPYARQAAAAVPVAPGQVELAVSVAVSWALEP